MSQITTICKAVLPVVVLLAMIAGCGTPNDQTPFDNDARKHADNWISGHAVAGTDSSSCTECHGADLRGGITNISCIQCHMGGAGSVHPLDWPAPTALNHSGYVKLRGTARCTNSNCHGANLLGGTTGPSCASCHIGGIISAHPLNWAGQISTAHGDYVDVNTAASCRNIYCHGANLEGISGLTPACNACHAMPEKARR